MKKLLLGASLSCLLAAPASADQSAKLTFAQGVVSAMDTASTCINAHNPRITEAESAWIIGKRPSCPAAAAWIMGNNLALSLLLPHNKWGDSIRKLEIGISFANVANNVVVGLTFKP